MPSSGRPPAPSSKISHAAAGAIALALLSALFGSCFAAGQPAAHPNVSSSAAASRTASGRAPSASQKAPVAKTVTKPTWAELTADQRTALAPLAGTWDTVSEAQKRKWLALSSNFPKMAAPEQAKLHSRMTEWVALSPQQRTQARLNFGETKQLAPGDKKAKWEEYQALPPEEKRRLAARAAKPPATAAAIKPVAPEKLAGVPKPHPKIDAKTPRIAVAPASDHNNPVPPTPLGAPPAATN